MKSTSHEFAIFTESLEPFKSNLDSGRVIDLDDPELYHRITRVLRLEMDESFILFDRTRHAHLQISQINKRSIQCSVIAVFFNPTYAPEINVLLSVLKKDALEQAIYGLTELGATTIQLVHTEKVHRTWGGPSEMERLQRIIVAAAEQSKNFALPTLYEPISLEDAIARYSTSGMKIFCDMQGEQIVPLLARSYVENPHAYALFIGPEGDLSFDEKARLRAADYYFCRLTPTVLRSVQAVSLAVGLIRSL